VVTIKYLGNLISPTQHTRYLSTRYLQFAYSPVYGLATMRTWLAPAVASLLINSSVAMSLTQQPLANNNHPQQMAERPRPVPGRNAASFTDGEDQLFETVHLVISPEIPVV
jgi:hypothetical protein